MAKTRLCDDSAAVALLVAAVKQCRKDIVRDDVPAVDRVEALDTILYLGGWNFGDEGPGGAGGQQIQPAHLRSGTGATTARGSTAARAVGSRAVKRC